MCLLAGVYCPVPLGELSKKEARVSILEKQLERYINLCMYTAGTIVVHEMIPTANLFSARAVILSLPLHVYVDRAVCKPAWQYIAPKTCTCYFTRIFSQKCTKYSESVLHNRGFFKRKSATEWNSG